MRFEVLRVPVAASDEMSRRNAAVIARMYETFTTGDAQETLEFVALDNVHHVPGRGLNAGDYWGHAGFARFMTNIRRYNGGVFMMSVPVFSVSGNDAFTREIVRINRAQDPERIWTLRFSNRFKMRDGQIAESWVIPENQRDYDDYWTGTFGTAASVASAPGCQPIDRLLDVDQAVSDETTSILAEMYRRFWRNDIGALRESFAEDLVVDIPGESDISGTYYGWDGFLAFRRKLMSLAGDRYKLDVVALAGSTHDAWATERIRMNRSWDPDVHELFVQMHFEFRHGRITRMNDFPFDAYAWEDFYTRRGGAS